jgi:hypothetical protein
MNLVILGIESVNQKIKTAPNDSYQIGVLIGSFLPMIVFAGIAYYLYFKAKNKDKIE